MAGLTLVTAAQEEPVTVAEVKNFCRVDVSDDDGLFNDLITAARKRCEDYRGRSFLTQTWDYFLDFFPQYSGGYAFDGFTPVGAQHGAGFPAASNWRGMPISLPRPPLLTVSYVKYTPYNASPITMDPATYQVDVANLMAPRIVPNFDKMWPTDLLQSANGVTVRFVAGYGPEPTDVPEHVKLALMQLVAFWYRNRDATGILPESINTLLDEVPGGFTYA